MIQTAVLTITRNEKYFFPRWIDHYASVGDLFVLDHESFDGSTGPSCGYARSIVCCPTTDNVQWMRQVVHEKIDRLLKCYKTVIFAEVDEYLIPEPALYSSLSEYIEQNTAPRLTATGFDVIPDGRWARTDQYDKTLIVRAPTQWVPGFHRVEKPTSGIPAPDSYLFLAHCHYEDREIAWNRLQSRQSGKELDSDSGSAFQNKYTHRVPFDAHFTESINRPSEPIPERIRRLLP